MERLRDVVELLVNYAFISLKHSYSLLDVGDARPYVSPENGAERADDSHCETEQSVVPTMVIHFLYHVRSNDPPKKGMSSLILSLSLSRTERSAARSVAVTIPTKSDHDKSSVSPILLCVRAVLSSTAY